MNTQPVEEAIQEKPERPTISCAKIEGFLLEDFDRLGAAVSPRYVRVICAYFGVEQGCVSLETIGQREHFSAERARQIVNEVLSRMRLWLRQRRHREATIPLKTVREVFLFPYRRALPEQMATLRDMFTSDEGFLSFLERYAQLKKKALVRLYYARVGKKAELKHLRWVELFPRLTLLDLQRAFVGELPEGEEFLIEINGVVSKVFLCDGNNGRVFECPVCREKVPELLVQGDSTLACECDMERRGFRSLVTHQGLKLRYQPIKRRRANPKGVDWLSEEKECVQELRSQGAAWVFICKVLQERFQRTVEPHDVARLCDRGSFMRAGFLRVGEMGSLPLSVWVEACGRTGVVWLSVPRIKVSNELKVLTLGRARVAHKYNPLRERHEKECADLTQRSGGNGRKNRDDSDRQHR